jgi:osmotically-inducible protein OsmY
VSRADLLRALAVRGVKPMVPATRDDAGIREQLLALLKREPWADTHFLNILVSEGVVHLWGLVRSEAERQALRVAAETTPGVLGVEDHLSLSRTLPAAL